METTASSEPGHRVFDGPAVPAEPLRGLDSLPGYAVPDTPLGSPSPQVGVVVSVAGVQFAGLAPTGTSPGSDRQYALHERDQGLAVVDVGTGDADRQGQTVPLCDQVDLRAVLVPVDRIRTRQPPLFSGPACSPSRSHSGTSPTRHGRRARRGPGGAASPTPWLSSIRRSAGELSPPMAQTGSAPPRAASQITACTEGALGPSGSRASSATCGAGKADRHPPSMMVRTAPARATRTGWPTGCCSSSPEPRGCSSSSRPSSCRKCPRTPTATWSR